MGFWKKLKYFFNKENYDFDRPDITLQNFHPQLFLCLTINGIILHHPKSRIRSLDSVSSIYGPPLVYQVMLSSVAICLMAYQTAEQLDNGRFDFLIAILIIAACVQLWIPCYLGTLIRNRAFDVGEACWSSGWHTTPLGLLLNDIITIILRAQQPLTIQFIGLPSLTLDTFSSIMSTSYSYFNMLRQPTKN